MSSAVQKPTGSDDPASPGTEVKPERPVHELAAVFPMLPDDELAQLATDIKENGLRYPIVLDANGAVVDGRNRLRACEIAGVAPRFEAFAGSAEEVAAFIVSANLARRNLSKGQQAMALAMIYPEPEKGGRGRVKERVEESSTFFSTKLLQQARLILRSSSDLAQDVLHGRKAFDVALSEVRAAEQRRKSHDAQMSALRKYAPDLAAIVEDGRMTLEAGLAQLGERQNEVRDSIEAAEDSARAFDGLDAHLLTIKAAVRRSDNELAMVGVKPEEFDVLGNLTDAKLAKAAAAIAELRKIKRAGRRR